MSKVNILRNYQNAEPKLMKLIFPAEPAKKLKLLNCLDHGRDAQNTYRHVAFVLLFNQFNFSIFLRSGWIKNNFHAVFCLPFLLYEASRGELDVKLKPKDVLPKKYKFPLITHLTAMLIHLIVKKIQQNFNFFVKFTRKIIRKANLAWSNFPIDRVKFKESQGKLKLQKIGRKITF